MDLELIRQLHQPAETKIILLVIDGLGGAPREPKGDTELETAETPHLDRLAEEGICGLHQPIRPGVTPGSGPSHLALFGYDPVKYQVGRGVLSALGIEFDLKNNDVAARGNFATIDESGVVTDRRAGRISTGKNEELCKLLQEIEIPDVEVFVKTVKEHRFLLVLRGEGLSGEVAETDPLEVNEKPKEPKPLSGEAQRTAQLVKTFEDKARQILTGHDPANMVLLRGFSKRPQWPQFPEVYGLRAAAVAAYPMYRGVASLVGMKPLDDPHFNVESHDDQYTQEWFVSLSESPTQFDVLQTEWQDFDFFFAHIKQADSVAEDGDFDRKVAIIEGVDSQIPRLLDLQPDVLIVTGDHSTPAVMKYHSWHPVPVVIWSKYCRPDEVKRFGERACITGALGSRIPAEDLMPIVMANARRLEKFGA